MRKPVPCLPISPRISPHLAAPRACDADHEAARVHHGAAGVAPRLVALRGDGDGGRVERVEVRDTRVEHQGGGVALALLVRVDNVREEVAPACVKGAEGGATAGERQHDEGGVDGELAHQALQTRYGEIRRRYGEIWG